MSALNESHVEDAALSWFGELGYAIGHGPRMAPSEAAAAEPACAEHADRRQSFGEVVLVEPLRDAIRRLNPAIPEEARKGAVAISATTQTKELKP